MSYKYRNPYAHTCTGTKDFGGCGAKFQSRFTNSVFCQDCRYRRTRWRAAIKHRENIGQKKINICRFCMGDVGVKHQHHCQARKRIKKIILGEIYIRKNMIQRANPTKCAKLVNDILKGRINLV